jgi:hypothetical protein
MQSLSMLFYAGNSEAPTLAAAYIALYHELSYR